MGVRPRFHHRLLLLSVVTAVWGFQIPPPLSRRFASAQHHPFKLLSANGDISATSSSKDDVSANEVPYLVNGGHNDAPVAVGAKDDGLSTVLHASSQEPNTPTPSVLVALSPPTPTDDMEPFKFQTTVYDLTQAALVGVIVGLSVAGFKLSVEFIRGLVYEQPLLLPYPELRMLIPALGGLMVGALLLLGKFPKGLRGAVEEIDQQTEPGTFDSRSKVTANAIRKSAAAVFTLGTGNSLGPEGPCVEIGVNTARACMDLHSHFGDMSRKEWHRILTACGGAAGVAAGFDAPVAGVFFALEVVQNVFPKDDDAARSNGLFSKTSTLTPVLLASILSALISRGVLGEHLILKLTKYSLASPLTELPMYFLLGLVSGAVAFAFSQLSKLSTSFFKGEVGDENLRELMSSIPKELRPALGGVICGGIGLVFPQILFFGYETLNSLLAKASQPSTLLFSLLFAKMGATAIAAGSGLVGGTFAPSLFLGAVTGALFYEALSNLCQLAMGTDSPLLVWGPIFQLADVQSYAMVGAASCLAALFRAPLTATLLLFELTRDYNVILPLLASVGLAALFADILDYKFERDKERRVKDEASWGETADPQKTSD